MPCSARAQDAADFAPRLVARAGAAVEPVEGRSLQKQRAHHDRVSRWSMIFSENRCPFFRIML